MTPSFIKCILRQRRFFCFAFVVLLQLMCRLLKTMINLVSLQSLLNIWHFYRYLCWYISHCVFHMLWWLRYFLNLLHYVTLSLSQYIFLLFFTHYTIGNISPEQCGSMCCICYFFFIQQKRAFRSSCEKLCYIRNWQQKEPCAASLNDKDFKIILWPSLFVCNCANE